MGVPATLSASAVQTWQAANPLPAFHFRCHLLRPANGLPVALLANQLSTVANRVLPFSALAPQGHLDASVAGPSSGRARTARKKPAPKCCHHGCPKCENGRGIREDLRL